MAFWSMSSGVDACVCAAERRAAVTPGVYHSRSGPAKTCYASRAVRSPLLPAATFVALAALALPLPGCGRRATQADCQLIVDRSVELQMKEMSETDPAAVAKREADVRAQLEDEIKSCERDRRVTERTMSCVQKATTTMELDKCLH